VFVKSPEGGALLHHPATVPAAVRVFDSPPIPSAGDACQDSCALSAAPRLKPRHLSRAQSWHLQPTYLLVVRNQTRLCGGHQIRLTIKVKSLSWLGMSEESMVLEYSPIRVVVDVLGD